MTTMQEISTSDLYQLYLDNKGIYLIDVRTLEEFKEAHAQPAINQPLNTLEAPKLTEVLNMPLHEPVYLICRSGARSAKAAEIFLQAGFTQVVNVIGGTVDWISKGLPTGSETVP